MNVDIDSLMERASERLRGLTADHEEHWGLGKAERWDADQESGVIRWEFKDGSVVTADFQIVGTYNLDDGSFLWAWDHPSVGENLRKDAEEVKAFGEENGVEFLTYRKLECGEDDAWDLVALAAMLCERSGAYRGPSGDAMVFMTFGDVKVLKKGA